MTRVILTAGKGGVGKSTIAAATAAVCAARGARALVMSIDSAHNLSDLLGTPLGHTPTPVSDGLSGLEVDVNRELAGHWDAVIDFFRTITANNPRVSEVVAEECAVLPGMEEVFGLMRLQSVVESGEFDVVVVDTPPTGDMLKFLRLPDVVNWVMGRYSPFERGVLMALRPVAEALSWPLPDEAALAQMERWYARVRQSAETLMDGRAASVRLVMTPDRVALSETRRAFTWTSLLGMNVDSVIVNRVLPREGCPPILRSWLETQELVLEEAERAFGDLPVLQAPLRREEVLGVAALRELGEEVFAGRDPAELWSRERPVMWAEDGERGELRLRLPFLKKGEFRLLTGQEGLTLLVGNQRRLIALPPAVRRRPMLGARYEDGWLRVQYGASPAETKE